MQNWLSEEGLTFLWTLYFMLICINPDKSFFVSVHLHEFILIYSSSTVKLLEM